MVVEWIPNNLFIKTVFLLQKLNKMFVILMDRLFHGSVTQVVQLLKKATDIEFVCLQIRDY